MPTNITRRQAIAQLAGVAGAAALAPSAIASTPHRKQLLVLFLSGGASQLETWDPKPGTKYGGPFRAINTSLDGVRIGELLPRTAKIMHRLAVCAV